MQFARIAAAFACPVLLALVAGALGDAQSAEAADDGDAVALLQRRPACQNQSFGGVSSAIVFMMSHGNLWRVSVDHPAGVKWSSDWDNPQSTWMTPDNRGGVFVISRSHLYHVTEDNHDGDLWSGGWDPRGIVTDGHDGVFINSMGRLYHVTPDAKDGNPMSDGYSFAGYDPNIMDRDGKGGVLIGKYAELWHASLLFPPFKIGESDYGSDIDAVTYDGVDGVFFIDYHGVGANGKLHHVDMTTGAKEEWVDGLHGKSTATDGNRGIFIVQKDGSLKHFSPSHKEGFFWSDGWHVQSRYDVTHRGGLYSDGGDGVFLQSEKSLFHIYPDKTDGDFWSSGWATDALFVVGK